MDKHLLISEKLRRALEEAAKKNSESKKIVDLLVHIEDYYSKNDTSAIKHISMLDTRKEDSDIVISYLAVGKEPEISERGKWLRKNRQQGKVGKVILGLITAFKDAIGYSLPSAIEIEKFVNAFKSSDENDPTKFTLVKGADINKYYSSQTYVSGSGSLQNSCMKYDECQEYFDVYSENPNCEMLIGYDSSLPENQTMLTKIHSRAIVWTFDGVKYVDRRYTTNDVIEQKMVNFIRENEWCYKERNSFEDEESTKFMCPNEEGAYVRRKIELNIPITTKVSKFPYLDTFKFYNPSTSELTNYHPNTISLRCTQTQGGYDIQGSYKCPVCGSTRTPYYNMKNGFICSSSGCTYYDSLLNAYNQISNSVLVHVIGGTIRIDKSFVESHCIEHEGKLYILGILFNSKVLTKNEYIRLTRFQQRNYKQINNEHFLLNV